MGKVNTTSNIGWLKSVEQRAAASLCSDFAGIKAEMSFGDHEVTLARSAATGIFVKGDVQQYTCTCFSAMTWIYNPYSVFFQPPRKSIPTYTLLEIFHALLKIFLFPFFFLETVLLGNYFAWLSLFMAIQAKALLWKRIFSTQSWSVCVTGRNAMTWSMWLSSLYKLLLPSYLSCYHSFLPHCKGWWHKTSSDTSLKINQKLQNTENNARDKGQIISRICKPRVNSKPLCCSSFLLSSRGFIYSSPGGKGQPPWSLRGQLPQTEWRVENWMTKVPAAKQISPKHKVFLWQQVNT